MVDFRRMVAPVYGIGEANTIRVRMIADLPGFR